MSPTEKLYWADPHALTFESGGARLASFGQGRQALGRPAIVLPRTLFYPEGGGQLGDRGALTVGDRVLRVADTQIEDGVIGHILEDALPDDLANVLESLTVSGAVEGARRRDHMVQHTAQHALSRALANAAHADTVSARLGLTSCTIDVAVPGLTDAALHLAEDLANAVVMSDVPVVTTFPTPEELATLPLRKQPSAEKSAAGVRVVAIEGFDLSPCGGTHCTRSGQIGQIRIVAIEKYKGMLRITFHAGARALADARARHDLLGALATDLTCGPSDALAALSKLRGELKGLRAKLDEARDELAGLVAGRLLAALPDAPVPQVVAVTRPLDDLAGLRALAAALTKEARVVALAAGLDDGSGETILVVQRGGAGALDCGAFVMAQARAHGGRGGGRPERAEGRFPRGTSLETLAAAARGAVTREK